MNATIEDLLARHMAAAGWDRHGELSSVHLGLNRSTWRVGDDLWLSRIDEPRVDLFHRECRLLTALRAACSDTGLAIAVPRVVPTTAGNDVITHAGRAYRATAHIPGVRPDDNRVDTFVTATHALRDVHAMLRSAPAALAVLEPDESQLALVLERSLSGDWAPVASSEPERTIVCRVAEWLAPRARRLADAPQQLVHGDWSTPNLLFDARATRTVGVLDWQLCSVGPVISDIAQAVVGVLMWSKLESGPAVDAIFDAYGDGADRRLLGPALASHWLRNYWLLRDELALDDRHQAAVDRQGGRLRAVMDYVEHLDNA